MAPVRPGIRFSVVIAASNGITLLEQCLRSLGEESCAQDTEVIVVTNFDGGAHAMLATQFPCVQHVSLPSGTTVPVLRAAGILHSGGEIVALAEDHCTFGQGWCSEIKNAHALPYLAIGGSIENATGERALDWAVYFYDYGRFMLPNPAGVVKALPGNNISFKRPLLEELEASYRAGFFEAFMIDELEKRGYPLYLTPSAIVYHRKTYQFAKQAVLCYHLARSFAGQRVRKFSFSRRAVYVLGSLALPILLPGRIVSRAVGKRRHLLELLRSLPYLLFLMTSWSLGEFCGYVAGEGPSTGQWK